MRQAVISAVIDYFDWCVILVLVVAANEPHVSLVRAYRHAQNVMKNTQIKLFLIACKARTGYMVFIDFV